MFVRILCLYKINLNKVVLEGIVKHQILLKVYGEKVTVFGFTSMFSFDGWKSLIIWIEWIFSYRKFLAE